jgi:uncharacterized membrane protein YecN with MAPEG domain
MARSADLKAKQHSIVRAAIVSLVLLASIYGTVYSLQPRLLMPAKIPNRSEFESRLSMARWMLPLVIQMLYCVHVVAAKRAYKAEWIDGSAFETKLTEDMKISIAILQNTVEQTVIFVLAHMICIVTMPTKMLCLIPISAISFLVGRVLFARGYSQGAPGRALGFLLTIYPSMFVAGLETVGSMSDILGLVR